MLFQIGGCDGQQFQIGGCDCYSSLNVFRVKAKQRLGFDRE